MLEGKDHNFQDLKNSQFCKVWILFSKHYAAESEHYEKSTICSQSWDCAYVSISEV